MTPEITLLHSLFNQSVKREKKEGNGVVRAYKKRGKLLKEITTIFYICVHVHTSTRVHTHSHTNTRVHTHSHTNTHVYTHAPAYAHTRASALTNKHKEKINLTPLKEV